jgi:hypothetical protein
MSNLTEKATSSRVKNRRIVILLSILCVALFIWAARIDWIHTTRTDKPKVIPLGTVQKITYLSSIGYFTQIDTEHSSLLLRGVTEFQRGDVLERRQGRWFGEVCAPARALCEEIISK